MFYAVKMRKEEVRVLLDSGAPVNCTDEKKLGEIGGTIAHEVPGRLWCANGQEVKVLGVAMVEVKGRGYKEEVEFWVIRNLGVGALLGSPWLLNWNPRIDWKTTDLFFSDEIQWKEVPESEKKYKKKGVRRRKERGDRRRKKEGRSAVRLSVLLPRKDDRRGE